MYVLETKESISLKIILFNFQDGRQNPKWLPKCHKFALSCISLYGNLQGWAQDLLGRDRDQDRDLSSRDRDETETFAKLSETRPRRDPRVSETRPRRDLFLVETISRHMAYKCMVYALHTVSQKKNPLD